MVQKNQHSSLVSVERMKTIKIIGVLLQPLLEQIQPKKKMIKKMNNSKSIIFNIDENELTLFDKEPKNSRQFWRLFLSC